jgi:predicted dehydrogenase
MYDCGAISNRVVIIGANGRQGQRYLRILKPITRVVGVVDPLYKGMLRPPTDIPSSSSVEAVLNMEFDAAIITVPHVYHAPIAKSVLQAGKAVIKEKPFALTRAEADELAMLARYVARPIFTITQRRHSPILSSALSYLPQVGQPMRFTYTYLIDKGTDNNDWRRQKYFSGGGVGIDMGYHLVDLVSELFGRPLAFRTQIFFLSLESFREGVEDVLCSDLDYGPGKVSGRLIVGRQFEKVECLRIYGMQDQLIIKRVGPRLEVNLKKQGVRQFLQFDEDRCFAEQIIYFLAHLANAEVMEQELQRHLKNMDDLQSMYDGVNGKEIFNSNLSDLVRELART